MRHYEKKVGLFIGRFQTFHYGHIDTLHQAKKKGITDFIISIGSSNKEHTIENPFTYKERETMITKILKSLKIKHIIVGIPDFDSDEDWKNYIIKNVPDFDIIISGNSQTSKIFKKTKYKVLELKITKDIKATTIRHLLHIEDKEKLKKLIPTQVLLYLDHIKANKRIAKYYRNEHIGPSLTVDGIVITKDKKIVIIQRKNFPFGYALPGGFVHYGETTEEALIREMKEEIGVKVNIRKLAGVMSDPKRDPRTHIISIVYIADIVSGTPKAGSDAKSIKTVRIQEAKKLKMVAGHDTFLKTIHIE